MYPGGCTDRHVRYSFEVVFGSVIDVHNQQQADQMYPTAQEAERADMFFIDESQE